MITTVKSLARLGRLGLILLLVGSSSVIWAKEASISDQAHYQRALKNMQASRYVQAMSELELIDENPDWLTRANFLKGYICFKWERYNEAINYFQTYQIKSPVSVPYVDYYIAQAYENAGRKATALNLYETLSTRADTDYLKVRCLRKAADLYVDLGKSGAAEQIRLDMIQRYPDFPEIPQVKLDQADTYALMGQSSKAADLYYNVMWNHPQVAVADKARKKLKDYQSRGLFQMPAVSVSEIYAYAERLYNAREYGKAAVQYENIVKNQHDYPLADDAALKMGLCAYYEGRYDDAVSAFQSVYHDFSDSNHRAQALYWLGKIYQARRQDERFIANAALMRAVFKDSVWTAKAVFDLANYYYEDQRDNERAIATYASIMETYSNNSLVDDAAWKAGWISYKRLHRSNQALDFWKRGGELLPNGDMSDRCFYWSGKLLEKQNRKEEAERAYQAVWDQHPFSFYALRLKDRFGLVQPIQPLPVQRLDFPDAHSRTVMQRCQELILLGLWSEAQSEVSNLIALVNNPDALGQMKIMMAELYFYAGRPNDALRLVKPQYDRLTEQGRYARIPREIWRMSFPLGYWSEVQQYASTYNTDPYWVLAVIREESMFQPEAKSWASAHGLMQVIPSTARLIAKDIGLTNFDMNKAMDPEVNIQMGTYYLSTMSNNYKDNKYLSLAAYNGGSGNVARWYKTYQPEDTDEFIESIPFKETYNYVKTVMTSYWRYQLVYGATDPNKVVAEAIYSDPTEAAN